MNSILQDIQSISRPKTLMMAAKNVVKLQNWHEREMSERELKELIEKEKSHETERQMRDAHYSAEAHIALLARLIHQSLIAHKINLPN